MDAAAAALISPRVRNGTRAEKALITISVNGEEREVPEGLSLAALVDWLKLPTDRIAVERNRAIVPRKDWAATSIQAGDRLEVVHFVGGGRNLTADVAQACAPQRPREHSRFFIRRRS